MASNQTASEKTPSTTTVGKTGSKSIEDMKTVAKFAGSGLLIGAAISFGYGAAAGRWWTGGTLLLWALALATAGGVLGFLFGIPKVLQGSQPAIPRGNSTSPSSAAISPTAGSPAPQSNTPETTPHADGYEQRVNTNLEQISDWLTKIIVGLGLTNLTSLPTYVNGLADRVAQGVELDVSRHHSFGMALTIYFCTGGFIFGYLTTRLYIQGALARAERDIATPPTDIVIQDVAALKVRMDLVEPKPVPPQSSPTDEAGDRDIVPETGEVDDEIRRLAKEYLEIRISDYGQRVAAKRKAAEAMFRYANDHKIPREKLANESDEGFLMALATTILAAPQDGDAELLMKSAARVPDMLYTRYRVALAVSELCQRGFVRAEHRAPLRAILTSYLDRADNSLRRALTTALKQIDMPA